MKKKYFISIVILMVLDYSIVQPKNSLHYSEIVENFFKLVKEEKPIEAVDYIFSFSPWKDRNQDAIENIKSNFGNLSSVAGKFISYKLLLEEDLVGQLVYLNYFVVYERQPLRFEFQFYKPEDVWNTYAFHYDTSLDDDFKSQGRAEVMATPFKQ